MAVIGANGGIGIHQVMMAKWANTRVVARGEVWPLVSEIRPLHEAEVVHERVERGEITGRAALRIA